jgi:hypothetical protein
MIRKDIGGNMVEAVRNASAVLVWTVLEPVLEEEVTRHGV